MTETTNFMEMISFPYYAHLQARLSNPVHSISWNKVALFGYIDILLYAKEQIPPAGFQRKIRMLYENYPNLAKNYPLLGDLDGHFRAVNRLDFEQTQQLTTAALNWHNTIQVIEKICLNLVSRKDNFSNSDQLNEALQRSLYQMNNASVLPKLSDFLDEEQEEIRRLVELKQYPATVFQKIKLRRQFYGTINTDKQPLQFLVAKDPELLGLISIINKTFFKLVNLINQKLPKPDRSLKTDQSSQDLSASHDYRLVITLSFDGEDENEYESGLFAKLRSLLRI
ncbi:MAG: hypothetical protein GXY86_03985 [Firmicutes bacterium]|nr:hypothetical protein [Bacillota bacterium]